MQLLYIAIATIALLLFLVFPTFRRHKDLSIFKGKFIAHRGLHNKENGIPENSLSAFLASAAEGFIIENDIHLTADGEVVVFHDGTLKRMCGVDVQIEDLTLRELRNYRLLNTDERIPTLKEVLTAVDGRVPLLIEIKCHKGNCAKLCSTAQAILKDYKGKYAVQSFFPQVVLWYRKNAKTVCRGFLASGKRVGGFVRRNLCPFLLNFIMHPDFIAYDHNYYKKFIFRLTKLLGAFTLGWTFTGKKELEQKKNDFDGYIFENFIP